MAVTLYTYLDTGAPTLTGVVGSLTTLLDAILVGTAGVAYGSKASSGWTTAYTGTNQRTYQQGTGSNSFFLHVNDAAAATAKEARVWGSELATSVLTGTNLFPTASQNSGLLYARKSNSADAVPRPWIALADSRTLYFFSQTGDVAATYSCWMFGEFYSFLTSDPARCMIMARVTENSATMTSGVEACDMHVSVGTTLVGHYIARGVQREVGAITAGKVGSQSFCAAGNVAFLGNVIFGNGADNRIYLSPVYLTSTTGGNTIRGRLRGFWHFCHPIADVADGQTFSGGVGDLQGKTFLVIKLGGNSGVYVIETSNTWEGN